jgi:hypothetical protein
MVPENFSCEERKRKKKEKLNTETQRRKNGKENGTKGDRRRLKSAEEE